MELISFAKRIFYKKKSYLNEPLFRNTLLITLTSILSAGNGLVFWLFTAKLYTSNDVGIATTLVSSAALVVLLSRVGLDFSLIRFFSERDKSKVFSTAMIITTVLSISLSLIFISRAGIWFSNLRSLRPEIIILYLLLVIANSFISITSLSFVALNRSDLYLKQNVFLTLRIVAAYFLHFLGYIGILCAMSISTAIAAVLSVELMRKLEIPFSFSMDRVFLAKSLSFSIGNYASNMFLIAPNYILPIMIFNELGAIDAAQYYIPFTIASSMFMVINSVSTCLFVEGSHGCALRQLVWRSLSITYFLIIPSGSFLYLSGGWILRILGNDYVFGLGIMQNIIIAALFAAVVYIYFSILRIKKNINKLITFSGLHFLLLIGLSYFLMKEFGASGVGYAWIISYGLMTLIILIQTKRCWKT
jgi:O-antigen/teichoic acid export membrane protein